MSIKIASDEVFFSTEAKEEVLDLTSDIQKIVSNKKIDDGICLLFAPHATGILILNENEAGIKNDYLKGLNEIAPKNNNWNHDKIDNNAHSHFKSAITGSEKTLPITNGKLDLGTWQNIFFIETDGPRNKRKITIKIIGKK